MTAEGSNNEADREPVDLDEARRLIEALERDLQQAGTDSARIEALRAEVEQLRQVLHADESTREDLRRGLHGVRELLHRASDEVVSDAFEASRYIAQLGRILGM